MLWYQLLRNDYRMQLFSSNPINRFPTDCKLWKQETRIGKLWATDQNSAIEQEY